MSAPGLVTLEKFTADPTDENAVQAEIDQRVTRATGTTTTSSSASNGTVTFKAEAGHMRGIPAIGRGVSGALPEDTPGYGLDDWPEPSEDA